jgi:hypothetical protein
LVEAFVAAGRVVLPAGYRPAVIELLTRLVVSPAKRDGYCRTIAAERDRAGVDRRLDELAGGNDIPEFEIARNGFGGLTDEQLADYAIDPDAIVAIADRLNHGDDLLEHLGSWYIRAGKQEANVIPENVERARELLLATVSDSANSATGTEGGHSVASTAASPPNRRRRRWIKLAVPVGLAASLLVAFYLGTVWRGRSDQRDVRLASVAVRGDVTRGIEDVALDVTNGTDRRAFLTVVGLASGQKRPGYYYRHQGKYLELPPSVTTEVKNLPPVELEGSTVLLLVTTDVPAGEVVRNVTPPTVTPETAEQDADHIRRSLGELNIRADVRVVPLPVTKR